MTFELRSSLFVLAFVPLMACAKHDDKKSLDQEGGTQDRKNLCQAPATKDLQPFRQSLLQEIASSQCPDHCPTETVTIPPSQPLPNSIGQRILLIDDAVLLPAMTRYHKRTIAALHLTDEGRYEEEAWTADLNPDAQRILQSIDQYQGLAPIECLDVGLPFLNKFGPTLPGLTGHGMDILPLLADYNPEAQFVVSENQFSEILTEDSLCPLLDADNAAAWQTLNTRVQNLGQSLAEVIRTYQINFVHLSWGLEDKGIRDEFKAACGSSKQPTTATVQKILGLYAQLFKDLGRIESPTKQGSEPVLIFQAATSAPYALQVNDASYSLDCQDIPGRIRVNAASYHASDIVQQGSLNLRPLPAHERNGQACTDFYVVTGYVGLYDKDARKERIYSAPLGLGYLPDPSWPSASSFANPLGLSYFLYHKQRQPKSSHADVLKSLKKDGPRIFDPLHYREFQLYP